MKKLALALMLCCTLIACEDKSSTQLKKEIGQMVLVGFRGKTLPDYLKKDLQEERIGGVILFDYDVVKKEFDRNIESPEQVKSLLNEIKENAKTPVFISIDQEGGIGGKVGIARLNPNYGFPATLSAQQLGARNDLVLTYRNAEIIAKTLKELGFNLNFAPVVDLNTNPDNPAIAGKQRSYSADPEAVTAHAEKVIEAHRKYNILTAIKHFPGHGSAWNDSHEGFVDLSDTWQPIELIPYQKLISRGKVDMVMTAHIFNKHLDPEVPGTLSKKVITGILREGMDFDGVVISDDLQMDAIKNHYTLEETVVKLVNAGVDILLVGNNMVLDTKVDEKIQKIILEKVESGEIPRERIKESYDRIIKLKAEAGILDGNN